MAQPPLSDALAQEALDEYYRAKKNATLAANNLRISRSTFRVRLEVARRRRLIPSFIDPNDKLDTKDRRIISLERECADLRATVKNLQDHVYDVSKVKEIITECRTPPIKRKWLKPKPTSNITGIPTALWSDWHWDEIIYPNQVNGVNAFDRKIAERRVKQLVTKTVDLLINHMAHPKYDYLVLDLGGDMISGNIHEELRETNEAPVSRSIINLLDNLISAIDFLKQYFKRISVYCVVGNHGRWDRKPRFKNRVFENFEWLLYQFLYRHYKDDDDISFEISDGSDIYYSIYNTRYLLTHGDQFKGGSGISGALSPLMIGDARKRKRATAVDQVYDYMVMGHWHELLFFKGIIVNGSLKGYDEYAFQHNFNFELPTQALWVTHPVWGMTARWPVFLEKPGTRF